MIGYLIDVLKNKKNKPSETIQQDDIDFLKNDIVSSEVENSEGINNSNEQAEFLEEEEEKRPKKKNKKGKEKKVWKRRRIPKNRGPLFIIGFIFLIVFLISKLMLLYSSKEYVLYARLNYIHSAKAYKVIYQIEDLDNSFGIKVDQKVCTPYYYTSTSTAVTKSSDACIKGKSVSIYEDRINIEYKGLPKYIGFDDLFLYLDKTKVKSDMVIGNVNVKLKYFNGKYQITSIYP